LRPHSGLVDPNYILREAQPLDDTVEFFNLSLGDKLTAQEKQALIS
jgi:hypothetical protein